MAMKQQTDFETNVKQQLDESVGQLDAATLSKLNQARRFALSQKTKIRSPYFTWLTGLASTAAVAMLVISIMPHSPEQVMPVLATEQWDILAMDNKEELDLYSELEFYQWLDDING
ncbi:MAG: DUF3619 family protein [Methylophagaceae bacterium]